MDYTSIRDSELSKYATRFRGEMQMLRLKVEAQNLWVTVKEVFWYWGTVAISGFAILYFGGPMLRQTLQEMVLSLSN